jgi:small-conductance mechanosensitive channel
MLPRIQTIFSTLKDFLTWLPDWAAALVILAAAIVLALGVFAVLQRVVRRLSRDRYPYLLTILTRIQPHARLSLVLIALLAAVPNAPVQPHTAALLGTTLLLMAIALIGWGAVIAANTAAELYLLRFRLDVEDNLTARKHVTQIQILLRAADTLIVVITIAAALMTFPSVRQYGVSLFASAGVAGLIAGLAARPVLTNLFAGVQLAMTQPIRIEDIVVVEGENGTIEEIGSTYVVIRIWDWRRMIVPLSYFIEKPFQNWTRQNSALMGTVMLYLDYRAPMEKIRQKATEIVSQSPLWNGSVVAVQVTDAKADTIEVRILVSAARSSAVFDLRCEVREKIIAFIVSECPEALPRSRQITEPTRDGTSVAAAPSRDAVTKSAAPDAPGA